MEAMKIIALTHLPLRSASGNRHQPFMTLAATQVPSISLTTNFQILNVLTGPREQHTRYGGGQNNDSPAVKIQFLKLRCKQTVKRGLEKEKETLGFLSEQNIEIVYLLHKSLPFEEATSDLSGV